MSRISRITEICPFISKKKGFRFKMRVSILLTVITLLRASAAVYPQTVTLDLQGVKVQKVLREIQKTTSYDFVYKSELFDDQETVTISKEEAPLTEVLDEVIPSHLAYQISDQTIIVKEKPAVVQDNTKAAQTGFIIEGKVVDESGESIPGVTILIGDTRVGTSTDIDGNYRLQVPAGENALTFSFVGFETETITIEAGQTVLDVQMKVDIQNLNEVVVTGFFIADAESYTGTTTQVSGEEVTSMGGNNLIENLALAAPSLQVVQNNALGSNPNGIPEIRLRGESVLGTNDLGQSSLLGDPNLPLFILDNFPVNVQRIIDLDQARVESIQILQDASATAIYGAQAANGVIVITTKKAEAGELLVTYSGNYDYDVADVESYDVLSGRELFDLQSELGMRPQTGIDGYETREIERFLAAGVDTDWLAQPVRNAFGQRHSLNLQGGTDEIRYGLDFNYLDRPGVMKGSGRETFGAAMRLTYDATEQLTFRNSLETNFNSASESPYGSFEYYTRMPSYLPIRNLDGSLTSTYSYNTSPTTTGVFSDGSGNEFYNPIYEAQAGNFDRSSYINFINNFEIIWSPIESLRFQGNVSYQRQTDEAEVFVSPFSFFQQELELNERGDYTKTNTDSERIDSRVTATYSEDFDGHILTFNLGGNINQNKAAQTGFNTYGYATDNPDPALSAGYRTGVAPESREETQRLVSSFAALNYNYKGRYLLDGAFNYSGSSATGANQRFAPIWSLGAGWNLHNERFAQNDVINTLRLTVTYGETGSVSFSSYQALTTARYETGARYLDRAGTSLIGIGNRDLTWQTQRELNVGLNYALFGNRVSGQAAIYRRNTVNTVTPVDAPPSFGFGSFVVNLGQIENRGFEFSSRFHVIKTKSLDVYFNVTAQGNQEKILSIGNGFTAINENASRGGLTEEQYAEALANDGEYTVLVETEGGGFSEVTRNLATESRNFLVRYEEGGSDDDIYVRHSLGVDPMTGEEFFLTPGGEATTEFGRAAIVNVGNTQPTVRGTFGPTIRYKSFNVQTIFQYEYGAQVLNSTLIDRIENSDKYGNVDRRVFTQGWLQPGDVVPYTTNVTLDGDDVIQRQTQPSTRFVQDNNFINFSSLNISYDFSSRLASKIRAKSIRVSMNFNNLFYLSTVRQERGTEYPFARSFTTGIRVSF